MMRRRILYIMGGVLGVFAILLLVLAGVGYWYTHRVPPAPLDKVTLFAGVTYTREIIREPVPQIWHVVALDLTNPDLRFMVTPRDDIAGYVHRARTTSEFLDEFDLQLAINGDFFDPWRDKHLFDYYPHSGDGVNIRGYTVNEGQVVTEGYAPPENFATVYITADNKVSFAPPDAPVFTAISGNMMALVEGEAPFVGESNAYLDDRHPRAAVALNQAGDTLLLVLIDGRQPNYSAGASLLELAAALRRYGGWSALNLDGGGSVTLVIEDANGKPQVLNSPIQSWIPGRERPVANHLGIFAGMP